MLHLQVQEVELQRVEVQFVSRILYEKVGAESKYFTIYGTEKAKEIF